MLSSPKGIFVFKKIKLTLKDFALFITISYHTNLCTFIEYFKEKIWDNGRISFCGALVGGGGGIDVVLLFVLEKVSIPQVENPEGEHCV